MVHLLKNENLTTDLKETQTIVFFDGVCSLCNRFIDWVVRNDNKSAIRMATIQGKTAHEKIPHYTESLDSIIVLYNNKIYEQSDAILIILNELSGFWSYGAKLKWIPRSTRDLVYRLVAKNRYRIFSKKNSCRIATAEEQDRFLP